MSKLREPSQQTALAEVERALSVLEGRHPEHERARRETLAAAQQRRVSIAKELRARARRRRRQFAVVVLNAVAFAAAGYVAWQFVVRARELRGQLARAEAPFSQSGWGEAASNVLSASTTLQADLPASSCFVAVSTSGGLLRVRQGTSSFEGSRSVGSCTCEPARVAIEMPAPSTTERVGVALMRIDGRAIGGPLGRASAPINPATWGDGGAECADAMFDGWIEAGRGPASPIDDRWLDAAPARASLRRAGFQMVAGVSAEHAFGIVVAKARDCVLVVSESGERLSLRAPGGKRLIERAPGALVWCGSEGTTMTVWREGDSPVNVLAAAAATLGGALGARECAELAGVHVAPGAIALSDADLAWDATHLLGASVRASTPPAPGAGILPLGPGAHDARLVALVLSPGARVASDPPTALASCDPPLVVGQLARESVCVHAGPATWWRQGDELAAAARGSLPFWLSTLEPIRESDAVARIPKLLTLARHLGAAGFAPTLLEGVTELADGVRVVGRADEDAIVAVGLGPTLPWVFPFTDQTLWTLDDSPRVIPLRPGASIKLGASPLPNAPLERRRTVVFRRAARL